MISRVGHYSNKIFSSWLFRSRFIGIKYYSNDFLQLFEWKFIRLIWKHYHSNNNVLIQIIFFYNNDYKTIKFLFYNYDYLNKK